MTHVTTPADPFVNIVRAGPKGAAPVVLLHAVSLDLTYWDAQFRALSQTHDVVAFDWPSHGHSGPLTGEVSFAGLAEVLAAVIERTVQEPVHVIGLSMGSMVAQRFALNHPGLVCSLCLIGSACTFADPARQALRERAAAIRQGGMAAALQASMERWFTPECRQKWPDVIDRASKSVLAGDPAVQATMWDMIASLDTQERLASLTCPTLVLAGSEDPSTPLAAAYVVGERIPGARVETIPDASHMATLEAPEVVSGLLDTFPSRGSEPENERAIRL